MKCYQRILSALKFIPKTPQQLADELFVHRRNIHQNLLLLLDQGTVFRKFFHNDKTNKPDYIYSSIRFPKRFHKNEYNSIEKTITFDVEKMVGDWDSIDMRTINQ